MAQQYSVATAVRCIIYADFSRRRTVSSAETLARLRSRALAHPLAPGRAANNYNHNNNRITYYAVPRRELIIDPAGVGVFDAACGRQSFTGTGNGVIVARRRTSFRCRANPVYARGRRGTPGLTHVVVFASFAVSR